jgi:RNA polymerase subunit RPABC4/transcription elongation factor Spt4
MFLIAGIQPRTRTIDPKARQCPACGLAQAYLKRIDHYFSLVFIPLIRVKTGQPQLVCDHCRRTSPSGEAVLTRGPIAHEAVRCPHCGKIIEPRFNYCPYCGKTI